MDVGTVITVIEKGLKIAEQLVEAGNSAGPAIKILLGVTEAQKKPGGITEADLDEAETNLYALLDDFNKPLARPT